MVCLSHLTSRVDYLLISFLFFSSFPFCFSCADIWGQDVNIASMMEKMSQPIRVHISEATFMALNHPCESEEGPVVTMENPNITINT